MVDSVELGVLEKLQGVCGRLPQPQDLIASLGIDSMGMAELTFDLERQFAIRMDDGVLDLETVAELIEYVRARIDSKAN